MDTSLLVRLPRELRDTIYTYLLYEPGDIKVFLKRDKTSGEPAPTIMYPDRRLHPLILTQTCSQIRQECLVVFYSINTFRIYPRLVDDADEWTLISLWLSQVGTRYPHALHYVNIYIGFKGDSDLPYWNVGGPLWTLAGRVANCICEARVLGVEVTFNMRLSCPLCDGIGSFDRYLQLERLSLTKEKKLLSQLDDEIARKKRQAQRARTNNSINEQQYHQIVG